MGEVPGQTASTILTDGIDVNVTYAGDNNHGELWECRLPFNLWTKKHLSHRYILSFLFVSSAAIVNLSSNTSPYWLNRAQEGGSGLRQKALFDYLSNSYQMTKRLDGLVLF